MPRSATQIAPRISLMLPWTRARPAATSGPISGATSIAPITTAVESWSSPSDARVAESAIMTK
jgi:hypothetical protein